MLVAARASLARLTVSPHGLLQESGTGTGTAPDSLAIQHEAAVILITELLGLLVAIIGESLTRSVASSAWPEPHLRAVILGLKEQK
jgi:hypothetical protein